MIRRAGTAVAGITLIEVMVVVAILAVLVALAAPNLSELFIRNRLDTATNEFMTALSFARSEAIRRGVPVSMRRASAASRDWTEGWEIFVDPNRNGVREAGEDLLRTGMALPTALTLRSSQAVSTFVPFTPEGRVGITLDDGTSALGARAIFVLCYGGVLNAGSRSRSRAVLVNSPGRARHGADSNSNGIPEDAFGNDVSSCSTPS